MLKSTRKCLIFRGLFNINIAAFFIRWEIVLHNRSLSGGGGEVNSMQGPAVYGLNEHRRLFRTLTSSF